MTQQLPQDVSARTNESVKIDVKLLKQKYFSSQKTEVKKIVFLNRNGLFHLIPWCVYSITKRSIFWCGERPLPVTMRSCQGKSAVSALGVVEGDSSVHGVHVGISTFRQQETHQLVVPSRGGQL